MSCKHVSSALYPPSASQSVYREDCTRCFDSIVSSSTGVRSLSTDNLYRMILLALMYVCIVSTEAVLAVASMHYYTTRPQGIPLFLTSGGVESK